MRVYKTDIVQEMARKTGLTAKAAQTYVDTVFDVMSTALKKGSEVQITGFGSFVVKDKPKRKYVLNGEVITSSKYKTVKFTCGTGLKAKVNKKRK